MENDPATGLRALAMPYWPGLPLDVVIGRIDPAASPPRSAQVLFDALGPPAEEADEPGPSWRDFPAQARYADGAAWIVLKVAEALAHAHGRGVRHRDVKPANVLLTYRGGPMLLDFNLAHAPQSAAQAVAAATGGTLPYMRPSNWPPFSTRIAGPRSARPPICMPSDWCSASS